MNGLETLLEVKLLQTQIASIQEQYLYETSLNSSVTVLANEKRHKKMEIIRNEIEKVKRRLTREKNFVLQVGNLTISDTGLHTHRRNSSVDFNTKPDKLEPRTGVSRMGVSLSHNTLLLNQQFQL